MITLLVVAAISQVRQCTTAYTYRPQAYVQPTYQQAAYNDRAAFVAVESAEDLLQTYGGLVGQQARYDQRAQQAQRSQQELNARLDRLSAALERLQSKIEPSEPALPPKSEIPTPSSAANYPASEAVPAPPTIAEVSASSKHADKAKQILAQHCAKCHTSPSSGGGGNSIFNQDGTLARLEPEDLLLIDQVIYSGSMPKGGIPLTSQEYSAIRAWIDESRNRISSTLKQSRGRKS